jgi:transcriptional regulator with XRE-family HTH domain
MPPNPRPADLTIGQRIRARRQLLGLSVRLTADRAGISHSNLSRIETGKVSADNRFTLSAIADALRCPVTELTGQAVAPVTADQAETGGAAYETMRAVVEADLAYEPVRTEPPPSLHELARDLDLVLSLRRKCDYTGAAHRLPDLVRGLHASAFGDQRPEALRLLVQADEAASWIVRYLGHPASAALVAERAQQAAELLGDPVMVGLASYGRAHAAVAVGLFGRSFTIADRAAADLAEHAALPDALPVRGQLLMTAGLARYALGDEAGALARVNEATDIAAHTGQGDAFWLSFGPTNIDFWRVSMLTDGGASDAAVELARTINPNDVPSTSKRTNFYMDTARALAALGRDEQAVRTLGTAKRLAPQRVRNNPLIKETARDLLERSQRNAVGMELRALAAWLGVGS